MSIVANPIGHFNDSTEKAILTPQNLQDSNRDKVSVAEQPCAPVRTLLRVHYAEGDDVRLLRGVEYDELCGPPDASGYRVCGTKLSAYPRKGEPEPVWIELTFAEAVAANGEAVGK